MTFEAAIEAAYVVFGRYPLRRDMDACPCCVDPGRQGALTRLELRAATADQLGHYAFKAMTTWGDADDYRHFLPRILALTLAPEAGAWPGLDLDLIASKLSYGGYTRWPEVERAAVRDVLRAIWDRVLAHDGAAGGPDPDDVLTAAHTLELDLEPFLARWAGDERRPAALRLADAVSSSGGPRPEALTAWLTSLARRRALERAFWRFDEDPEAAATLSRALDDWDAAARQS